MPRYPFFPAKEIIEPADCPGVAVDGSGNHCFYIQIERINNTISELECPVRNCPLIGGVVLRAAVEDNE